MLININYRYRTPEEQPGAHIHGSMDILNTINPEVLKEYIENAPSIQSISVPLREAEEIEFYPSPSGKQKTIKGPNELTISISKEKRSYQKMMDSQKEKLIKLFNEHGERR